MKKWSLLAVVGLLILAAFAAWRFAGGKPNADVFLPGIPVVVAAPATRRDIEESLEAIGNTSSWESIEVRPSVAEVVAAIHFSDGQLVHKGDLLVTLQQQEEAARLRQARAFLDEQIREVTRIEGLVARRSLSQNQLDERKTLRDVAHARVSEAEAAIADRTIRAPFDGVLGLRSVSTGALATPEVVITTLDDIVTLRLDFAVPSLQLAQMHVGSTVRATTPAIAGTEFAGVVIGIDSRVNPVDRSVVVRARLDNSALVLRPGMLLNVVLSYARRSALMIPEEAVIHYQRDHFVLLVDRRDGNRLQRRDITIGTRIPGRVEVQSGLQEGDLVVTEGLTAARPGQQVRLRGAGS